MTKRDIKKVYDRMDEKADLVVFKEFEERMKPIVEGSKKLLDDFIKEHD